MMKKVMKKHRFFFLFPIKCGIFSYFSEADVFAPLFLKKWKAQIFQIGILFLIQLILGNMRQRTIKCFPKPTNQRLF